MSQLRKIGVASGTFVIAISIGFVMQNGDAHAARGGLAASFGSQDPQTPDVPQASDTRETSLQALAMAAGLIAPTRDTATPAIPQRPSEAAASIQLPAQDAGVQNAVLVTPDVSFENVERMTAPLTRDRDLASAVDCTPVLSGRAGPAASVLLTLSAPCSGHADVRVHHQGMMFDMKTDSNGTASSVVPALAANAVFIAEVTGDEGAVTSVNVPDLAEYDRAVLQWDGATDFTINARTSASTGAGADIILAASVDGVVASDEAMIVRLGDDSIVGGYNAEIYTIPAQLNAQVGAMALSVEAQVTQANCGQRVAAQTMQFDADGTTRILDLDVAMPDCASVGETLVLNNMLKDMTLSVR